MPFFHSLLVLLLWSQWIFFLLSYDILSKYIQLIFKGLYDAAGFIIVFMILLLMFTLQFFVLGVTFDDGDPYS